MNAESLCPLLQKVVNFIKWGKGDKGDKGDKGNKGEKGDKTLKGKAEGTVIRGNGLFQKNLT